MILSEKASAFFIENLISKTDKKPKSLAKNVKQFKSDDSNAIFNSCSSSSSSSSFSSLYQHNSNNTNNASPNRDCVSPVSSN